MATKKSTAKKAATSVPTRRRVTGSITDQIDRLEVGESVSRSRRIPLDGSDEDTGETIKAALTALRSHASADMSRAIDDEFDTREFVTESGAYLVDSKSAIVATATITRTA